jgi:hypothetical protein
LPRNKEVLLRNKSLTEEKQFFCQEVKPKKERLFIKRYNFSQETIKRVSR